MARNSSRRHKVRISEDRIITAFLSDSQHVDLEFGLGDLSTALLFTSSLFTLQIFRKTLNESVLMDAV